MVYQQQYRYISIFIDYNRDDYVEFFCFNFKLNHPFGFYETTKKYFSAKKEYVIKEEDEDIWTTFDTDNIYVGVNQETLEDILE